MDHGQPLMVRWDSPDHSRSHMRSPQHGCVMTSPCWILRSHPRFLRHALAGISHTTHRIGCSFTRSTTSHKHEPKKNNRRNICTSHSYHWFSMVLHFLMWPWRIPWSDTLPMSVVNVRASANLLWASSSLVLQQALEGWWTVGEVSSKLLLL